MIDSARQNSNFGLDGIDYLVFRLLNQRARYAFLTILNEIFSSGSFPNEWNKYVNFFIPKKESDKFRPIFLAQCSLKIIERMIYNRINWWIESQNLLLNSQYGFWNEKSCADNLSFFHTDISLSFENNETVAALFLDIQGA